MPEGADLPDHFRFVCRSAASGEPREHRSEADAGREASDSRERDMTPLATVGVGKGARTIEGDRMAFWIAQEVDAEVALRVGDDVVGVAPGHGRDVVDVEIAVRAEAGTVALARYWL